jgi:hypothetical protein
MRTKRTKRRPRRKPEQPETMNDSTLKRKLEEDDDEATEVEDKAEHAIAQPSKKQKPPPVMSTQSARVCSFFHSRLH